MEHNKDFMNEFERQAVADAILSHYDEGDQSDSIQLPSMWQYGQVVHFRLDEAMPPYNATVKGIRFLKGKVKYDLDVWIGEGGNKVARLPNIDSAFVHDAFSKKED